MDSIALMQLMLRDPVYHKFSWPRYQMPRRPTTLQQVEEREKALGIRFPPLLKRIYSEVANGGIGPVYGLFPLEELCNNQALPVREDILPGIPVCLVRKADLVPDTAGDDYELSIEERDWIWLPGLIQVAHGGCQYCYYFYANSKKYPILMNEEPIFPPDALLDFPGEKALLEYFGCLEADSFDTWISDWIATFQNEHKRDYSNLAVLAELLPEPRYTN
ncbi:SMI1/KNR4 family protein [Armatimonas rosea]|uniref:Knr4/Smi1-like domain-containing protein n=1 Tax=Armatimonas rosea TaxID=685828 RepID=A0A7W9W742_ARMRO|nr:SMI1/KNR4 family protein [Armatimonas rosea]MBB6050222.1 hypothetical protein [Armatimonas rosea]